MYKFILLLLLLVVPASGQPYVSTVAGNPRQLAPAAELLANFTSLAQDKAGNIYACGGDQNVIRRLRPDGMIDIYAGTGVSGFSGDGGPALAAKLYYPVFCTVDSRGNLVFADFLNQRIRRITPSGIISTVAGTGDFPQSSDPVSTQNIDFLTGLAVDSAGGIYFAEMLNYTQYSARRIRRITPNGSIELVPADPTVVTLPGYLAVDAANNLYVADGRTVFRITAAGAVSTFAGNGSAPPQVGTGDGGAAAATALGSITALTIDSTGNLFLTETVGARARIRRVDTKGVITSVAGATTGLASDGPALDAYLSEAANLLVDGEGSLWFTKASSQMIAQVKDGTLRTVAGQSVKAAPDGMAAREAWLVNPSAIAVNRGGDLFIAERGGGCRIRKIGPDGLLASVPGTGDCLTFFTSAWMAAGSDTLYVTNGWGSGGSTYALKQGVLTKIPNLPGGKMVVDSQDRLYVLDSNGQVWRLVPGGTPELYIASATAARISISLLRLPHAIAIDQADNLYLRQVQFDSSIVGIRIYVISPTGSVGQKTSAAPDFLLGLPNSQTIAIDRAGNVWETSIASAQCMLRGQPSRANR